MKDKKVPMMKRWKMGFMALLTLAVLVVGAMFLVRHIYQENLRPVSNSQQVKLVTVPLGSSIHQIAVILQDQGLIRHAWAFEWYVRNSEVRNNLEAGTYALRPSQGVADIVSSLAQGNIATSLVTILPGQRLDQIRVSLINDGFKPKDVDAALNPALYANHPALSDKPPKASLEGYLYPDSFQKTDTTTPQDIIKASLDEMQKRFTPELRTAIAKQGLTVHQGIILASIVEQEVGNKADRPIVAQVFLSRRHMGMQLGSDVTAFYGSIIAGQAPSLSYDSPYNTRIHTGLPPGPISNVSISSLKAVAHPANTDYLYFVAGDDGKTYFGKTLEEHQSNVQHYCKKLCN